MAVTNIKGGKVVSGTGAPEDGDRLCTNTKSFPIGTTYINRTNSKVYIRVDDDGDAADWTTAD